VDIVNNFAIYVLELSVDQAVASSGKTNWVGLLDTKALEEEAGLVCGTVPEFGERMKKATLT
jgi:hypothetical protein